MARAVCQTAPRSPVQPVWRLFPGRGGVAYLSEPNASAATEAFLSGRRLLGDWRFYMLPKLLYELMPVLYVAVGFSAALLLYNSYAILSGILLLIVAIVILYMRLESRTEAMERQRPYTQKKSQKRE